MAKGRNKNKDRDGSASAVGGSSRPKTSQFFFLNIGIFISIIKFAYQVNYLFLNFESSCAYISCLWKLTVCGYAGVLQIAKRITMIVTASQYQLTSLWMMI